MIASILTILFVFVTLPLSSHAQEGNTNPENIGVSTICPDESFNDGIHLNSTSRPTKIRNLAKNGKYYFKGTIKNTGKSVLTVKAKRLSHTYTTARIKAGKSKTVSFSNIKATTEFYLTFEESSFSGYINNYLNVYCLI